MVFQNNGTAAIKWTDDGTTPTSTNGMVLNPNAELDYAGDIASFQFIQVSSGAIADYTLYR
jgi:hypothetical protein